MTDLNSTKFHEAIEECEKVSQAWKDVKWDELTQGLDLEARELIKSRDTLSNSKKRLTASTKEWVQLPDSHKLDGIKGEQGLLKQYQEHISSLTSHSGTIETAFLSLYKVLTGVTAPTHALSLVIKEKRLCQNLLDSEKEKEQLRESIKRHKAELQELTNQEVTILDLKQTIAELKEEFEREVALAIQRGREEGQRESNNLFEELKQRENAMTSELTRAGDERNKQAELSEQIQIEMVHTQEKMDQLVSATEYSEDCLRQENDGLRSQIAILREELSSLQKSFDERMSTQLLEVSEQANVLRERITQRDQSNQSLQEQIVDLQNELLLSKKTTDSQTKTIEASSEQIASLREQVRDALGSSESVKRVDVAVEKELDGLKEEKAALSDRIQTLEADLDEKHKLIARMEEDISVITSDTTTKVTLDDNECSQQALKVVSGQRDRYKRGLFELEAEHTRLKKRYQEATVSNQDAHRLLVQENQSLFEKLKSHHPHHHHHHHHPDSGSVAVQMPMMAPPRSVVTAVDSAYRFISSTTYTKVAFFLYFAFLHLVVFFLVSRVNRDTHSRSALRYPHHGTAAF